MAAHTGRQTYHFHELSSRNRLGGCLLALIANKGRQDHESPSGTGCLGRRLLKRELTPEMVEVVRASKTELVAARETEERRLRAYGYFGVAPACRTSVKIGSGS